jgi:pimeloyl-ACP methyl ester carboxylesterase
MAEKYHVLALDQRGHGDTGWAPGGDYGPASFLQDIVGFIDALQLAPTVLVGHSMGGRHAAMIAADHPDRVHKLVIVDTPVNCPADVGHVDAAERRDVLPAAEVFETFEEVIANGIGQYP